MAHRNIVDLPITDGDFPARKLLPSGKHTKNSGTSPFFMAKSTISIGPRSSSQTVNVYQVGYLSRYVLAPRSCACRSWPSAMASFPGGDGFAMASRGSRVWLLEDIFPTQINIHIYSHPQIDGKVNHHQISRDLLFHLFGDDYRFQHRFQHIFSWDVDGYHSLVPFVFVVFDVSRAFLPGVRDWAHTYTLS